MTEYRKAVLSFVDVLGFRDIVSKSSATEVERMMRRLVGTARPLLNTSADEIAFINFSDNLVRVALLPENATYEDIVHRLYFEVSDLGGAQALLSQRGIFVRGGISVGDVVLQDNILFGPGLIRAHKVESRVAQAPRIVLDPDVVSEWELDKRLLDVDFDDGSADEYQCRAYLSRDTDQMVFIDYIRGVVWEGDDPAGTATINLFENHRDSIVRRFRDSPKEAWLKYYWLRDYHNRSLSVIPDPVLTHNRRTATELECQWPSQPMPIWRAT